MCIFACIHQIKKIVNLLPSCCCFVLCWNISEPILIWSNLYKCVLNHAEFLCVDMSDLNLSKPCCLSTWNVCMVNCFALWDLQQYVTPLPLHIVRTLSTSLAFYLNVSLWFLVILSWIFFLMSFFSTVPWFHCMRHIFPFSKFSSLHECMFISTFHLCTSLLAAFSVL